MSVVYAILEQLCNWQRLYRKPNITSEWRSLSKSPEDNKYSFLNISGPGHYKMVDAESVGQRKFWESLPFRENYKLYLYKDEL